jgi:hypothetical protein
MRYIDGQKNKYSVLNKCNRMLKYNIYIGVQEARGQRGGTEPNGEYAFSCGKGNGNY